MIVNKVKQYRTDIGYTQAQLADLVSVSSRTIISIENQKYNPTLELAFRIALVLNHELSDVFTYKED